MREELSELMAAQRAAVDLQALRDHSYSAIQDELQVGGRAGGLEAWQGCCLALLGLLCA